MKTTRRQFIATSLLMPLPLWAEPLLGSENKAGDNLGGAIKPYTVIGNFADDKNRVFMFISYSCPYCKETWKGFLDWGLSLPNPFKFVFVPLSFGDASLEMATRAFYVVRDVAPNKIEAFNQIAFEKAPTIQRWSEWDSILQRHLGLSVTSISGSLNKPITHQRIHRARKLAQRYRVSSTPFFGIGGKYATSADLTNGNYQLLVQLLNALVSEMMSS